MLTVDFDRLGLKSGERLLDAGCGEGRHSIEGMIRGARVWGMDMDMPSLLKARFNLGMMAKAKMTHPEGRYLTHIGDARHLPFPDETFDRVICSEVMEHVDDDNRACAEMVRVLKTGGTIAITVPTYFTELINDALTWEYFHNSPGGHIRKYLPGRLARIMRANGLDIYHVGFKHAFHSIYWMIRSVVGLHDNNQPITKAYRSFLTLGLYSKLMRRVERFFNWFFPKSVVLYGVKR